MWAEAGDNRGMKQLWTDAPGAEEHLDALYKRRRIRKAERDDLARCFARATDPDALVTY